MHQPAPSHFTLVIAGSNLAVRLQRDLARLSAAQALLDELEVLRVLCGMPRIRTTPAPGPAPTRPSTAPDNTWDALASGSGRKPAGWKPPSTDRSKYTSPAQKAALKQCDAVVTSLKKALAAKNLPEGLKGLRPKDVSVDLLGAFPYVTVKKNGSPLFDRNSEVEALRKLLPATLRRVPIGDVSPF